jgi:hypothetical protein
MLLFGSCRLNFKLTKYKAKRPAYIKYIHNHNDILNLIRFIEKNNYSDIKLSPYSKLSNTKNNLLMEIDSNDTIILEICSNKTYYEFINEETTIVSNIYEYINTATINNNNNYIKFSNTSQSRNANILQYFYRIDNINLKGKIIFDNIILGNYIKNKQFLEISYNEKKQHTCIKIIDMPNNYFNTFSINFETKPPQHVLLKPYTIKCNITTDFVDDILYIKYYNGSEYIYTDQIVNESILLHFNSNEKTPLSLYNIGFYRKNVNGDIMTGDMLSLMNQYNWNITLNIDNYELIINNFDYVDITLPKKFYINNESNDDFIYNINELVKYFKNKKLIIVSHFYIKENNEEKIPKYVNESRLKYINFLKQKLINIPNCYFFENHVTNDLIEDEYHYNDFGYKTVGEKFEKFLDTIITP